MKDQSHKAWISYIKNILLETRLDPELTYEIKHEILEDPDFLEIEENLLDLRNALNSMGKGDLSYTIRGKGHVLGGVKNLQAALRTLTWKTKNIALGDFSQDVDFLGDFSIAFNSMVKQLEQSTNALKESEMRHRLLADNVKDVIWTMNPDGKLTYVSPSVLQLRGYTPEETMEQTGEELLCPNSVHHLEEGLKTIKDHLEAHIKMEPFRNDLEQPCKDGSTVWVDTTVSAIYDKDNQFVSIVGVSRDISERRKMEDQIRRLSVTDKLTQLYNRCKIDETLKVELERADRMQTSLSVIMADVDFFKKVNDGYGHQVGDLVLIQLAEILKYNVRDIDILGRWGGEEFIVILPGTGEQGAAVLAEKLRLKIQDAEFEKAGRITASFGIAELKAGMSVENLINQADRALYQAKNNGRNRIEISRV